jgi:hypothetical protein
MFHPASGSALLDRSKVPRDLLVHRVWIKEDESGRRATAYVGERRRRIIAVAVIVAAVVATAVAMLNGAFWLAFALLLAAWAGTAYAQGGQSGFYEVAEDGGLGRYLGKELPQEFLRKR